MQKRSPENMLSVLTVVIFACFALSRAINQDDVYKFLIEFQCPPDVRRLEAIDVATDVNGRRISYRDVMEMLPRSCEEWPSAMSTIIYSEADKEMITEACNLLVKIAETILVRVADYRTSTDKKKKMKNVSAMVNKIRFNVVDAKANLPNVCLRYVGIQQQNVFDSDTTMVKGCDYLEWNAVKLLATFESKGPMPTPRYQPEGGITYLQFKWMVPIVCTHGVNPRLSASFPPNPGFEERIRSTCDFLYGRVLIVLKAMASSPLLASKGGDDLYQAVTTFRVPFRRFDITFEDIMPYIRVVCKKIRDDGQYGEFNSPVERENVIAMCNNVDRYP